MTTPEHLSARNIKIFTLSEADGYKITYYEQANISNKIIISFDSINSGISEAGFGTKFSIDNGYNHIFVSQKARTQYQDLSIEKFYDGVKGVVGSRNVFTYGSSLGGYCALYYGGCINATIIAAAPKNSALPDFLKPEFEGIFKHLPLSEVPKSSRRPIILYDPFRVSDERMVKQFVMTAYANPIIIELPFAGHNVLKPMQKSGILKSFIKNIIDNNHVIDVNLDETPSQKGLKSKLLVEKSDHLVRSGSPAEACTLLSEAISLRRTVKAYRMLARALVDVGNTHEAMACISHGLEFFPKDAALLQLLQDIEAREARQQPIYKQLLRKLVLGLPRSKES